jgi:hypothetical protein
VVVIVKHRYIRGPLTGPKGARRSLSKDAKYIQYRSMGERENQETRQIFDRDRVGINRRAMVDDVMCRTTTSVNYHKLILSPARDERVEDWRQWTRQVMADLEAKQGKQLTWYAVQHSNTDYPHVHVIVAGAGQRSDGQSQPVRLDPTDYTRMKESGREHSLRDFDRMVQGHNDRDAVERQAEREEYRELIAALQGSSREDRDRRRPGQIERERRYEEQQRDRNR